MWDGFWVLANKRAWDRMPARVQEIAAKNYYRPTLDSVAKKYANQFAKVNLIKIDDVFGGWQKAQKTHFNDGGVFDEIILKK